MTQGCGDLCQILHIPEDQCEATTRTTSTMPFGVGWDGTSERNEDQFARILGELG